MLRNAKIPFNGGIYSDLSPATKATVCSPKFLSGEASLIGFQGTEIESR